MSETDIISLEHDQDAGDAAGKPRFSPSSLCVSPGPAVDPSALTGELIERLRPQYADPKVLPFHSWEHPLQVRSDALALVARCRESGTEVDSVAVEQAALLHDVFHILDPSVLGFDSREGLAASYAYNLLRRLGAPEAHARKVERIVWATHALAEPQTVEEIVLRAADLRNLAGTYEEFRASTERLYLEHKGMGGKETSFAQFALRSIDHLALYAWRLFKLTPQALNSRGASDWHERLMQNMIRLNSELCGGRDRLIVSLYTGPTCFPPVSLARAASDQVLLVAVNSDPALLEETLQATRNMKARGIIKAPAIFLPGTTDALPLPDQSCDEVVVSAEASDSPEIRRVLRKNGKLVSLR